MDLIGKAEDEAEELGVAERTSLASERDELLAGRAQIAADEDALAMEREAFEAEQESLEAQRRQLENDRPEMDKTMELIERKQSILAEAQEAFVAERTLLQRRWAEVEKQGVVALERAHEQAERILNVANEQAADLKTPLNTNHQHDEADATTAQEALARLDRVLASTRRLAEDRTAAEEGEGGDDNETIMSGVWDQIVDEPEAGSGDVAAFSVPTDDATS
ncbi:MAG: hypothetical protein U9N84_08570 [Actinomycetota bacterium]|nr:hypothetical protein [Actinomycetota bacterium]